VGEETTGDGIPATLVPALRSRFPCKWRALFGLYAEMGADHEAFESELTNWCRSRERARGHWARAGVRIPGSEPLLQEAIGARVGEVISPLDGYLAIDIEHYTPTDGDFLALLDVVGELASGLPGVVDTTRSFAMAGLANLVLAGEGPESMMLMCAHHPAVEPAATNAWWCSFGDVVRGGVSSHMLGYHQVQCDAERSERIAAASGLAPTAFDLGDLVYLTDVESFVAANAAHPPSGDPGPPMNQRDDFISFEGSVGAFCRTIT
jgi:hypothetical protein